MGEETFKLWLKSATKEFGVYVVIRFEVGSDRVISIRVTKTVR
ncbi:DUF3889 domain-containing protein [Ferviditalea candida]